MEGGDGGEGRGWRGGEGDGREERGGDEGGGEGRGGVRGEEGERNWEWTGGGGEE